MRGSVAATGAPVTRGVAGWAGLGLFWVLVVAGGAGLALYVWLWLLMPEEGADGAPAQFPMFIATGRRPE